MGRLDGETDGWNVGDCVGDFRDGGFEGEDEGLRLGEKVSPKAVGPEVTTN